MARGGHHGGGFHGGGHHFSGGGFHGGGGFGGGSYHGGSYHGGGGYADEGEDLIVKFIFVVIVAVAYFAYAVAIGNVPGMNLINLGMFAVSVLFYFLALKAFGRQEGIYHLHQTSIFPKLQVWKADYKNYAPAGTVSDKVSWAEKSGSKYRIAFYDRDFGEENIRKVNELIKRTPKIIWMSSVVWLIVGIFFACATPVFYEFLIPYFETREMTDEAFAFVDELIFYLPAGITLLSALSCYILMVVRDNLLHKCALRIVEDNNAAFERMKTEEFIVSTLSSKWYYNNCPNCGAAAENDMLYCNHCGTSLEVEDKDKANISAVHLISSEAEKLGAMPEIKRHTD